MKKKIRNIRKKRKQGKRRTVVAAAGGGGGGGGGGAAAANLGVFFPAANYLMYPRTRTTSTKYPSEGPSVGPNEKPSGPKPGPTPGPKPGPPPSDKGNKTKTEIGKDVGTALGTAVAVGIGSQLGFSPRTSEAIYHSLRGMTQPVQGTATTSNRRGTGLSDTAQEWKNKTKMDTSKRRSQEEIELLSKKHDVNLYEDLPSLQNATDLYADMPLLDTGDTETHQVADLSGKGVSSRLGNESNLRNRKIDTEEAKASRNLRSFLKQETSQSILHESPHMKVHLGDLVSDPTFTTKPISGVARGQFKLMKTAMEEGVADAFDFPHNGETFAYFDSAFPKQEAIFYINQKRPMTWAQRQGFSKGGVTKLINNDPSENGLEFSSNGLEKVWLNNKNSRRLDLKTDEIPIFEHGNDHYTVENGQLKIYRPSNKGKINEYWENVNQSSSLQNGDIVDVTGWNSNEMRVSNLDNSLKYASSNDSVFDVVPNTNSKAYPEIGGSNTMPDVNAYEDIPEWGE